MHAPPCPQVMKVCFILVLGHRYETCTLVFYRGVFLKKTVAQSALMPHYSIEKMVSKKTCAPPFYRGCFAGGACTPTIYIYKMGGTSAPPEFTGGYFSMFQDTCTCAVLPVCLVMFCGSATSRTYDDYKRSSSQYPREFNRLLQVLFQEAKM